MIAALMLACSFSTRLMAVTTPLTDPASKLAPTPVSSTNFPITEVRGPRQEALEHGARPAAHQREMNPIELRQRFNDDIEAALLRNEARIDHERDLGRQPADLAQ